LPELFPGFAGMLLGFCPDFDTKHLVIPATAKYG